MRPDALARLERQLVAALAAPRPHELIPEVGRLIWRCFVDLSATRSMSLGGPCPISFAEIEAYGRVHKLPFDAHHIRLIRSMDSAWLGRQDHGKHKERFQVPVGKLPELTAAAFDAVFS